MSVVQVTICNKKKVQDSDFLLKTSKIEKITITQKKAQEIQYLLIVFTVVLIL